MGQCFVWRPTSVARDVADRRFAAEIEQRRHALTAAMGRDYVATSGRVDGVYLATISTDLGVSGWSPWVECSGLGVAWAGVCETFLGTPWNRSRVEDAVGTILDRPEETAGWQGSFAAVAWDVEAGRVGVVTGAAQSQTLWCTEGPDGWACGSRARPLLDLVGRTPRIDLANASLFLSFGYLAGDGSLFQQVDRLGSRKHVAFAPGAEPIVTEPVSLPAFLHQDEGAALPLDDVAGRCAEVYAARVGRQYRHSRLPVLSLTGGRDSRSIAAALSHTDFTGPTRTGGVPESEDVVHARHVADALGFTHQNDVSRVDLVERLSASVDAAVAWSWFSEGVETIRHALHYPSFFEAEAPFAGPREQQFNGLRPFLNRRDSPAWQRESLRNSIRTDVKHRASALERYDDVAQRIATEVSAAGGDASHFAELHFWQVKVLHSGQDNILTKDAFTLWWTPLVDAALIRANWHLPTDALPRAAFIESLTRALEPGLVSLPYAGAPKSRLHRVLRRVRRKLPPPFRPSKPRHFAVSSVRSRAWEEIFFDREALVWPDLVEPGVVRRMVDANPDAHLLWSLATVELFAQAHLSQASPERVLDRARGSSPARSSRQPRGSEQP